MDATPRLIIIDDDPLLAEVLVHTARDAYPHAEDLEIECALTAEAALVAIRRIDAADDLTLVVISDFHLPPSEITGLDILAEVKRRLPRAARVLMSGRDPEELAPLIDAARIDAFVPKPFTFDRMRALIVALVERRPAASAGYVALEIETPTLRAPLPVWWGAVSREGGSEPASEGSNARAAGNAQTRID